MNNIIKTLISCGLMLLLIQVNTNAQTTQPTWWFGLSGAANISRYTGTTQRLNDGLIVPTAFHKGKGVRPFGSFLIEYRPGNIWGGTLNLGYDGRGGKFDGVVAPCNCPATLSTKLSYLTIEPALRFSPGGGNFYLFAGPRVAVNLQKGFSYTQLKQTDKEGDLSQMRKTLVSGQIGMGYDIPVSGPASTTKFVISPFVSYHPYFGQDVRSIESWSVSTLRAGIALKLGKGKKAAIVETPSVPPVLIPEVSFSVRAPKDKLVSHKVSETLPLLNYVFFDQGSTAIPARYIALSKDQATDFREMQLQNSGTPDMTGRSARQMNVYYNVLNVVGDRMRSDQSINIVLSGASKNGPSEGKSFASAIKNYLTSAFDIAGDRIAVNGRTKPIIPSEQPGGKKELELLREGDRRVDIQSSSKALMLEVGGGMIRPVQISTVQSDPLDSKILFNVPEAEKVLSSYAIDITDQAGTVQHFGPFHANQESVSGASVLGANQSADYKVVMTGTTKSGATTKKESTLHLQAQPEVTENGSRYSILFNFNKATTVATYEKFLTDVVAPLIVDGSTVIIHGHTDVIGSETYNAKLSVERAKQAQQIIEAALTKAGKTGVKIETVGFGEALDHAPFNNGLPEERFYNRTVIIDIATQ